MTRGGPSPRPKKGCGSYAKTALGKNLHRLLKSHEYIGVLFEELIKDRLSSSRW